MKWMRWTPIIFCLTLLQTAFGQTPYDSREAFLSDTACINAILVTNMGRIFKRSNHGDISYGHFITSLPNGKPVDDKIMLEIRGHFRQGYCYVPPLKLKFNYGDSTALGFLKSLKMVSECKVSTDNDQNLLKEYLIYKMYNLVTALSFHNRLVHLTFEDSAGIKKPITEHAFLLEDIADVARRNNCLERKEKKLNTEQTNRRQMTVVALFEFMIGNTDWAVSVNHNTRLIVLARDTSSQPFVVPYDFDYSGLVNTEYAAPDEKLEIESVTQRLYRGFARTMPELQEVLDTFRLLKKDFYAVINNCSLLTKKSKGSMIDYLDGFYDVINNERMVKTLFIDNARKE
jgi:hypothetical protein